MKNAKLVIDGSIADLPDDFTCPINIQDFDLLDIESFLGNYTNSFTLPDTINNRNIFNSYFQSQSTFPYTIVNCDYYEDGVPLIQYGKLSLNRITSDGYECNIYFGNSDILDELDSSNLADLDLTAYEFKWSRAAIIANATNTSGAVFALIDYVINGGGASSALNNPYRVDKSLPSMFIKTIFDEIISSLGYTYTGDFKTSDFFEKLMMNVVTIHGRDSTCHNFIGKIATLTTGGGFPLLNFDSVTQDLSIIKESQYPGVPGYTVHFFEARTDISIITINITGDCPAGTNLEFYGYRYDSLWRIPAEIINLYSKTINTGALTSFNETFTIALRKGEMAYFYILNDQVCTDITYTGTCEVNEKNVLLEYYQASSWIPFSVPIFMLTDELIPLAANLPEWSQLQFLKNICSVLGIYINKVDRFRKVIEFAYIDDIIKNKKFAVDWSDKLDMTATPEIAFQIDGYAQENWFKYSGDNIFGNDYISNNNANIDDEIDLISLDFEFLNQFQSLGLNIVPAVPMYNDVDGEWDNDGQPGIFIYDPHLANIRYTDEDGYTDVSSSASPFVYNFDATDLTKKQLPFHYLIADSYKLITAINNSSKTMIGSFALGLIDIKNIDKSIPVYLKQYNSYFYINRVNNFIDGELTEVELIKI